jgi:hypothetical protein
VAAYVRLVDAEKVSRCGRFSAVAVEATRRIFVDDARRKKRVRHGGNCQHMLPDE